MFKERRVHHTDAAFSSFHPRQLDSLKIKGQKEAGPLKTQSKDKKLPTIGKQQLHSSDMYKQHALPKGVSIYKM